MNVIPATDRMVHIYWKNIDGDLQHMECESWPIAIHCVETIIEYAANNKKTLNEIGFRLIHNVINSRSVNVSMNLMDNSPIAIRLNWN